ncbi:MAG: 16S rRNA (cytidine(1402)-2'-O)-methyltransferase [Luminiphilus sp.]
MPKCRRGQGADPVRDTDKREEDDLKAASRQYSCNRVNMARCGVIEVNARLFIIATPIGNLGDMTARALSTLRDVDLIAAEDTRHSALLMRHFSIATPLVSYHDHSKEADLIQLLEHMRSGRSLALISDAGTPLVSDPGYRLVAACHAENIPVVPIPGASALTAALSASGLPTDRFHFEGFLPAKAGQRIARIKAIQYLESTLVLFESPRRLPESLLALLEVLGNREATLCREITKAHETIRRDSLHGLHGFVKVDAQQLKGEAVLVVRGFEPQRDALNPEAMRLVERLAQELPPRRAAAVAADVTDGSAKALYQWLLEKKHLS